MEDIGEVNDYNALVRMKTLSEVVDPSCMALWIEQ